MKSKLNDYIAKSKYISKQVAKKYEYSRFSSPQGQLRNKLELSTVSKLLTKVEKKSLVLDLACATGRITKLLLRESYHVICADVSIEMLKATKLNCEREGVFDLIRCDAERLPFKKDTIDCVVSIRFLALLPRLVRQKILIEMKRVSSSWVLVNIPNLLSIIMLGKVLGVVKGWGINYFPANPFSINAVLEEIGFEIVNIDGPIIVPPGRLPSKVMKYVALINMKINSSALSIFSEQYFILLSTFRNRKR